MPRYGAVDPDELLGVEHAADGLEQAIAVARGPVVDPLARLPADWLRPHGLCALLSGRTAIDPSAAAGLARWVTARHRTAIGPELLATLIREALMNAAIHGNLRLPGLTAFAGDFERYEQAIAARLADPEIAGLPVVVLCRAIPTLCVLHVLDHGGGHAGHISRPEAEETSGRGLFLVRSIADRFRVTAGGRCLSMGLRHDG